MSSKSIVVTLFDDDSVKEKLTILDKTDTMADDSRNPSFNDLWEFMENNCELGDSFRITVEKLPKYTFTINAQGIVWFEGDNFSFFTPKYNEDIKYDDGEDIYFEDENVVKTFLNGKFHTSLKLNDYKCKGC